MFSKVSTGLVILASMICIEVRADQAAIRKAVSLDSIVVGVSKGVEKKFSTKKAKVICGKLSEETFELTAQQEDYAEFKATLSCNKQTQVSEEESSFILEITGSTSTPDSSDPEISIENIKLDIAG